MKNSRFIIPEYDCKICLNAGLLEFKQNGKTYPNAPCPICRYFDLRRWLNRWGLDPSIAAWLWKHYSPRLTVAQRQNQRRIIDYCRHHKFPKSPEKLPDEFLNEPLQ